VPVTKQSVNAFRFHGYRTRGKGDQSYSTLEKLNPSLERAESQGKTAPLPSVGEGPTKEKKGTTEFPLGGRKMTGLPAESGLKIGKAARAHRAYNRKKFCSSERLGRTAHGSLHPPVARQLSHLSLPQLLGKGSQGLQRWNRKRIAEHVWST